MSEYRLCSECGRRIDDGDVAWMIPTGEGSNERRQCDDCHYDFGVRAADDARMWGR